MDEILLKQQGKLMQQFIEYRGYLKTGLLNKEALI
jgi:hypothetical protein